MFCIIYISLPSSRKQMKEFCAADFAMKNMQFLPPPNIHMYLICDFLVQMYTQISAI